MNIPQGSLIAWLALAVAAGGGILPWVLNTGDGPRPV